MKRRILSLCLLFVIVVLSVSCKKEDVDLLNKAVVIGPPEAGCVSAARDYANSIGGDYIEYASSSDAVVAVINGKADYVVLDEYSGYTFEEQNKELCFCEKCDYSIEYRACFSIDNIELCEKFNEAFYALEKDGTIDEIKASAYKNEDYIVAETEAVNGVLTMVCDPIFDNRVYLDGEEVKGVDVNIAQEVCNYLGYRLVIKTVQFEDMFVALDNGEADFIMSCVERTDQRAQHYLFSDIYTTYNYNVYKLK